GRVVGIETGPEAAQVRLVVVRVAEQREQHRREVGGLDLELDAAVGLQLVGGELCEGDALRLALANVECRREPLATLGVDAVTTERPTAGLDERLRTGSVERVLRRARIEGP